MSEHIQAIYENGVLRPLQPLDLPENTVVEIDVRDVSENDANYKDSIEKNLAGLETEESKHLEEEFEDYEQLHPRR